MSTRCNIIIKEDNKNLLYFYRHSDGYPEGVKPTLTLLLKHLKEGNLRNNLSQFAGHLIVLGAIEYQSIPEYKGKRHNIESIKYSDWKVGAYEPTDSIHGDIEYLYEFNLNEKEIVVKEVYYENSNYNDMKFKVLETIK